MSLSANDPGPTGRNRPPLWTIALVVTLVAIVVALHLTGVIGKG